MLARPTRQSIAYRLGTWQPTLASRSTGGAAVGAAGVRALNDGVVPAPAAAGGRGGGAGARGAGPGLEGHRQTSRSSPGPGREARRSGCSTRFPATKPCRRPKCSGRHRRCRGASLYQDGSTWKEVVAKGAYGLTPNAFNAVEFAPVRTTADAAGSHDGADGERRPRRMARRPGSGAGAFRGPPGSIRRSRSTATRSTGRSR